MLIPDRDAFIAYLKRWRATLPERRSFANGRTKKVLAAVDFENIARDSCH